ncbi:MAG: dihydrofolate reductase [Lachnospiraceae bacterium]|nr:dihydrofolate reductase [Lachnospira sp.]MBR6697556.1 dihydrofolate reductase [Lachnospiraceae bacterium]
MNILVTTDSKWAIGKNGKQFVNIPENDKLIRQETEGKVVVMGRLAYALFENAFSLGKRKLIVLTNDKKFDKKNVQCVYSVDELLEELKQYNSEDIFIVGGASVFEQLLDKCDVVHLTKINYSYEADKYFPNLDENAAWKITNRSDEKTYFDLEYEFIQYEKVK